MKLPTRVGRALIGPSDGGFPPTCYLLLAAACQPAACSWSPRTGAVEDVPQPEPVRVGGAAAENGKLGQGDQARALVVPVAQDEVIDPGTVKMGFAKPFPGIFRMLAQFKGGEIVAKEAVEQNGDLARTGMGTGPFMFDHWTPGTEIVLKKNPQYWRQGLPYLDGITFKIIPDEAGIVAGGVAECDCGGRDDAAAGCE